MLPSVMRRGLTLRGVGCRIDPTHAEGKSLKARDQKPQSRNRRGAGQDAQDSNRRARARRELLAVRHAAHRRYHSYPNVLGVGIGTKFQRRSPNAPFARRIRDLTCIQFFVTRKRKGIPPRHRLPGFVYHRFPDGRVDRRRKIPTDVIPVGGMRAACGAGSPLSCNGDRGLITLIFRNQVEAGKPFYLISCAHVVGDMGRSPPACDAVTTEDSTAALFARTVVTSTAEAGVVAYDIGLARIQDGILPLREMRIRDEAAPLDSLLPLRSIQQGLGVTAVLKNCSRHGTVDSLHAAADVSYGGETFLVENLFGINVAASTGDSGGLIHADARAVGIVVATSPGGWLWFQPLESALLFLNGISPVGIRVFNP